MNCLPTGKQFYQLHLIYSPHTHTFWTAFFTAYQWKEKLAEKFIITRKYRYSKLQPGFKGKSKVEIETFLAIIEISFWNSLPRRTVGQNGQF